MAIQPRELFSKPPVIGGDTVEAPFVSPQRQAGFQDIARREQRGSFMPELGELGAVESGEATGFTGSVQRGFSEGLVGYLLNKGFDTFDPAEERAFEESTRNYAENNFWKDFAGNVIGRSLSDSPIDIGVSLGLTQVGKQLIRLGKSASVSTKAIDKVEQSVTTLQKLAKTPEVNPTLFEVAKREALEGMLAGMISESALQSMGKAGDGGDLIEAAVGDAIGGVALSSLFRTISLLPGFNKKELEKSVAEAVSETTDVPAKDLTKAMREREIFDVVEERVSEPTPRPTEEPEVELYNAVGERFSREVLQTDEPNFVRRAVEGELGRQKVSQIQESAEVAFDDTIESALEVSFGKAVEQKRFERAYQRSLDREARAGERARVGAEDLLSETKQYIDDLEVSGRELIEEAELGVRQAEGVLADEEAAKQALRAAQIRAAQLQVKAEKQKANLEKINNDTRLLGPGDDLAKLSKDSGVSVRDLEQLRDIQYQRMREINEARKANEISIDDLKTTADKIDGDIRDGKLVPPGVRSDAELPAVRNLDEFDTMMRYTADSKLSGSQLDAYVGLAKELISVRAKALGVSSENWLKTHKITYKSSDGIPHVAFEDAATILNAPAKATSIEDFFHELGHIFEADLDAKTRKTFADHYGMDGFSENFSEKFANDFLRYLADARGRKKSPFPKDLKAAFNRVAEWLSEVFKNLIGKGKNTKINNEVRDMFDRLFLDNAQRSSLARIQQRRARFVKEIGDENVRYRTADEIGGDVFDLEGRAKEIRENIESAHREILEGKVPLAAGGLFNTGIKKAPKFLGAGILTAENLFRGLGKQFSDVYDRLLKGVENETALIFKRRKAMRSISEEVGLKESDLDSLDKKTVEFKGKKIRANEAILLHMYARDGMKEGSTDSAKNSARTALVSHGYKFDGDSVETKFTKEEVNDMSTEAWLSSVVGDEAVRAATVMRKSLDQFGKEFNEFYKARTGEDAFSLDQNYFHKSSEVSTDIQTKKMKKVKDSEGNTISVNEFEWELMSELQKANGAGRGKDKRVLFRTLADTTAVNHVREGNSVLKYQDPFASTMQYVNQLSRLEALADTLTEAQAMHSALEGVIKRQAGDNVFEAMGDILERASGQGALSDPIAGKTFNKLYKGQVMAALSWNLSTPLKQTPSMMAALMRIPGIQDGAGGYAKYLKAGLENKIEIDGKETNLHEYLLENSPTYAVRYETSGQSPDISDANISDVFRSNLFGSIKVSQALENQGLVGGFKAIVEKGMTGIREADAAAIRGIYLAVRDSLGDKATPEAIEEMATKIINETQPTYHPLTRTSVQASRNIIHRQLALFSSQPVKNFNLFMRDLQQIQAGELKGEDLAAAKKRMRMTYKMLALQASAVAGAGIAAGKVKDFALESMTDEEVQAEKDRYLESHGLETAKEWGQVFSATFGNLPYSGPLLGEMLKRFTLKDGFDIEVMPINYVNDIYKWAESVGEESFGRNTQKMMIEMMSMFGMPRTFTQVGQAAASNVEL
jgi:hypothetical protein